MNAFGVLALALALYQPAPIDPIVSTVPSAVPGQPIVLAGAPGEMVTLDVTAHVPVTEPEAARNVCFSLTPNAAMTIIGMSIEQPAWDIENIASASGEDPYPYKVWSNWVVTRVWAVASDIPVEPGATATYTMPCIEPGDMGRVRFWIELQE